MCCSCRPLRASTLSLSRYTSLSLSLSRSHGACAIRRCASAPVPRVACSARETRRDSESEYRTVARQPVSQAASIRIHNARNQLKAARRRQRTARLTLRVGNAYKTVNSLRAYVTRRVCVCVCLCASVCYCVCVCRCACVCV